MKRVALIGLASPAAIEALRVLSIHPTIELACVVDDALAGRRVAEVYPGLSVANTLAIQDVDAAQSEDWDLAIVDAEQDFDAGNRPCVLLDSGWRDDAATGMSFRHEALIAASKLVRTPSPTEHALNALLLPLAKQGLLSGTVQGVSMLSGDGSGSDEILKSEDASNALRFLSGDDDSSAFDIALVKNNAEMGRGLLLTAFIELSESLTLSTVDNLYREYYEPALFYSQMTAPLDVAAVIGSNRAHFFLRASGNQLCATLALDVLGRGSAMQAIECANLMLGLPEEAGLLFPGHAGY